jgi:uncharacterized protein
VPGDIIPVGSKMSPYSDAIFETKDGIAIALDVSAGAKKSAFPAGYNEWRKSIRCQVAAPAVGGKANRAIIELIAAVLDVPRTSVSISSGAASSSKTITVTGKSKDEILALLRS